MHKCDLTGDIDTFLKAAQAKDPNTYATTKAEWDAAKKSGATAAYVAFYTDSAQHCTQVGSSSSDISTANFKLVVNFVVQFKDEASAAKGYTTETIFGFSSATLKGGGAPVQEGKATGLGANSIVLSVTVATQSFYVTVWQHKQFMVILVALDLDATAAKKVALAEDGRIK